LISASQDLGGLGTYEGPAVAYTWVPPNILPALIPWLALIALLALKFNRRGAAWWISIPALFALGLERALSGLDQGSVGMPLDQIGESFQSLVFATAAVWLISPRLVSKNRGGAFFKILLTLIAVDGLLLLVRGLSDLGGPEAFLFALMSGFAGFIIVLSLVLAGLLSRRAYRPLRFLLWFALLSLALCTLIPAPFFALITITRGTSLPISEFISLVLALEVLCLGPVLPFLLLSFANGFYRERFIALFDIGRNEPPPVITPVPGADLARGQLVSH
jgi:hypothetical protein